MNLMFSTCRSLQTGLILLALGACSKEPAPPQIAPLAPAVDACARVICERAKVSATSTQRESQRRTTRHSRKAERLRIAEQRADSRNGEYEFRGARLLHYSGSGLSSRGAESSCASICRARWSWRSRRSGTVPPEEISAIRERAQLLRSHALAQKTTTIITEESG